jgi:hypothetical protein
MLMAKIKMLVGLEDYNDAHDNDASGTSEDDTSGASDTSRDDTSHVGDTSWYDIGGTSDVDGDIIGCDDLGTIGHDDKVVTCCDDLGAKGDDDGVVICCDDSKGVFDDRRSSIGEGKPPNYEPCSIITYVNDAATWRVFKSIDSFTIDGRTKWGMVFSVIHLLSFFSTSLWALGLSCPKPLPLPWN